jgi:hypothetical protein
MTRLLSVLVVLMGLTFAQQAQAQLRVKPFSQFGTVGGQSFTGVGFDLTGIVNPETGLFLSVSGSGGENGKEYWMDGGESYFNMREFAVGRSTPSGFTYFGGITAADLETWFTGGSYQAEISGFFAGIGAIQPFGPGVFSLSGSFAIGSIQSNLSNFYCNTYSSPWYSSTYCGNDTQWHDSDATGIVYALAYVYPVSDWITVGVEHKNRSFSYQGYFGEDQTIDIKLNRVFLDMTFR